MNLVLSRHAQVGDEDFAVVGLHAILGVTEAAYGDENKWNFANILH